MKIKHLLIAALATVALAACNKENGGNEEVLDGGTHYVAFQIAAPGSKAVEAGADFENAVHDVHFFFYKNGNYVTKGTVNGFTPTFEPVGGKDYSHRMTNAVVALKSDGPKPNQVLAVLNALNPSVFEGVNLDRALNLLQDDNADDGSKCSNYVVEHNGLLYFTMSNASYFSASKAVTATSITDVFDTESDALNNPVWMYVDRLAAKVETTIGTSTATVVVTANATNVNYEVTVKGWTLNGVNETGYIFKHINNAWMEDTYASFNEDWMRTLPGTFRSGWAEDPNYAVTATHDKSSYPVTNREYNQDKSPLVYGLSRALYKRAKLANLDNPAHNTVTMDMINKQYCYENTFNEVLAESFRNVGTHVLVFAQAKKEGEADYTDVYEYHKNYLNEADYLQRILDDSKGSGETKREFFIGANETAAAGNAITTANLKIEHAIMENNIIKKPTAGHCNFRVSAFIDETTIPSGSKLYVSRNGAALVEATADDKTIAFGENVYALANKLENGWMVYFVPIKHTNGYTEPGKVFEGNYGVVRNNWYKVETGAINTLGMGIWDPETGDNVQIVPDDKNDNWYLAAQIRINAWNVVTQTSPLEE